jgi:hypothetical protein
VFSVRYEVDFKNIIYINFKLIIGIRLVSH